MSFQSLGLKAELVRAVSEKGYSTPTPIQQQAIPCLKQSISPFAKDPLIDRLTKLDYLVKVLLGSFLVAHTSSFYPRAVPVKSSALLFV